MNKCLLVLCVLGMAAPAWGESLNLCQRGTVCWTDLSQGEAQTELRLTAQGGSALMTVGPRITSLDVTASVRSLLPSDWLCVQARQRAKDGTFSAWYLSDKEGVCKPMDAVLPPDLEPEIPPQADSFGTVTQSATKLAIEYPVADCPRGVQQTTSAVKDGRRTITLTCRK